MRYVGSIAFALAVAISAVPALADQATRTVDTRRELQAKACLDAGRHVSWTSPDQKEAWIELCGSGQIGTQKPDSKQSLILDSTFFEEIYSNPALLPFVKAVTVSGLNVKSFHLKDLEIGNLTFSQCTFDGTIGIAGGNWKTLQFQQSRADEIIVSGGKGEGLGFNNFKAKAIRIDGVTLGDLWINDTHSTVATLWSLKIATDLYLLGDEIDYLYVDKLNVGGDISVHGLSTAKTLITRTSVGNLTQIDLPVILSAQALAKIAKQELPGELDIPPTFVLKSITTKALNIAGIIPDTIAGNVANKVSITGLQFTSADWGETPEITLKAIDKVNVDFDPAFPGYLAKAYGDRGRSSTARAILIEGENNRLRHAELWSEIAFGWLSWALSDFGYRPEIGFIWIAAFVIAGTAIFRSGSRVVIGNVQPRSWFAFSLDAVLPGIHLDESHGHIKFSGWRQYFLYFLRFLGAVVVVLILSLLKRSIG